MGQAAVVDLPDPLNPPPAAPADAVATTDDLLARMAGEEIDRLLAEHDGERPASASLPPSRAVPALQPPTASAPADVKAKPDPVKSLLGELANDPAERDPLAGLLSVDTRASQPPEGKSVAELLDEEIAADEARAALSSAGLNAEEEADAGIDAPAAAVPAPLRVLAWVSSPLDSFPDHVRELIGKVAILTSVNALAVLIYVLFFRQHHG